MSQRSKKTKKTKKHDKRHVAQYTQQCARVCMQYERYVNNAFGVRALSNSVRAHQRKTKTKLQNGLAARSIRSNQAGARDNDDASARKKIQELSDANNAIVDCRSSNLRSDSSRRKKTTDRPRSSEERKAVFFRHARSAHNDARIARNNKQHV